MVEMRKFCSFGAVELCSLAERTDLRVGSLSERLGFRTIVSFIRTANWVAEQVVWAWEYCLCIRTTNWVAEREVWSLETLFVDSQSELGRSAIRLLGRLASLVAQRIDLYLFF
ncbi:hypothetical protein LR48_Vigan05g178800 [Vigna angularis]|uniref:Uncharacterized protein n=1 Tax=Phaseolus angularis TaxID=3914 RepID=A0A0L9UN44_PHAAN|nr:hypothetical protein LR48_Vigan05g178800 [Vigna angularis]